MDRDINELRTDLERKLHTLETISEFSRSLNTARTLKEVCDIIMLTCMGHKGIEMTALLLREEDLPETFSVRFVRGTDTIFTGELIHFSPTLIRQLTENQHPLAMSNYTGENARTMQLLESLNCRMLVPLYYQARLTGMLSCGPKISGREYLDDDTWFLQLITSHAGIAISNILMLDHLEKNNLKLERKIFELQAVDEVNKALTSSLELKKVCHTLILTVTGYLTAESGSFYIHVLHDDPAPWEQFLHVTSVGTVPPDSFQTFQTDIELLNRAGQQQMIRKDSELPEALSRLFQELEAEICFPAAGSGKMLGLCFFGGKLTGLPYKTQELELASLLVRQAYSPIRNSQFYSKICEYSQGLEQMVEKRTAELTRANAEILSLNERLKAENLRMGAELDVTRRLQKMVLPRGEELQEIEGMDIACFMEPADEVGGDYYDILRHEGNIKIGIGDVTGHGLESGVVMLMTQAVVRTLLTSGETDPVRFLNILNRTIYDNVRRMGIDKMMTLALLDYKSGMLRISGYHEEVIVVRRDGRVSLVETKGMWLGLEPDITQYLPGTESEISLEPGDGVVLFTDGFTEAENMENELYGLERLCEVISHNWEKSAEEIRQAVVDDVRRHIGEHKVYDDLTLVVLKQY